MNLISIQYLQLGNCAYVAKTQTAGTWRARYPTPTLDKRLLREFLKCHVLNIDLKPWIDGPRRDLVAKAASAKFLTDTLGLPEARPFAHFLEILTRPYGSGEPREGTTK